VFVQTTARGFQPDNVANLSIQVDTNGRANALWGDWASPNSAVLVDLNAAAGGKPQPIYYSPAANGIGTQGLQIYAFVSGSLYERSPLVSGWNVNRDAAADPPLGSGFNSADVPRKAAPPPFVPTLFVATNPRKITDTAPAFASVPIGTGALSTFIISKKLGGPSTGPCPTLPATDDLGICLSTDPVGGTNHDPTYADGSTPGIPIHTRLGIHSQFTSSPLLILNAVTDEPEVLLSVYDPDYGCNGYSYIIITKLKLSADCDVAPAFDTTTVYAAGPGAASGFVTTTQGSFAGKSGPKTTDASLFNVGGLPPPPAGRPIFVPVWWKEQK
jgi:hypothetical protein